MKKLSSIVFLLALLISFSSCSDKNSLQNYILNNAENSGFFSGSIPKSVFKPKSAELNEAQLEAYEAIDRINVLAFQVTPNNQDAYDEEHEKVKSILKQDQYQELISLGSKGFIKYTGDDEAMDEIVIFMTKKELGFAVARIVGDDMTMNKFMELYKMMSEQGFNADGVDLGVFSNFMDLSQ